MKKYLIIAAFSTLSMACSQQKTAEIEQIEKEVMAVHDEIMPQTSEIMKLQDAVSQQINVLDSLGKIKMTDDLQAQKTKALALSSALKEADESMMNWMHQYNGDSLKTLEGEAAIKAFTAEKEKINTVKTKMLESISKAKEFLKQ